MNDEVKFLGLLFDKKLNFKSTLQYGKKKCRKALNILRVLGHTVWGADKSTLLKLYRTLVRSKLDYGSAVYGSTKDYIFKRTRPNSPSASAHCFKRFSHIASAKSLCRGEGAVSETSTPQTIDEYLY